MSLKVGTICYATEQGLGLLARDFINNGVVTDILIVHHSSHKTHEEWYNGATVIRADQWTKERRTVCQFIEKQNAMLFFETPFYWNGLDHCRQVGVRSVLMPMYECMPVHLPSQPDIIISPSLLDQRYYPRSEFIPVPVDVPWRQREEARVFVHNAGHGGLRRRNGTGLLLDALKHVTSPIKLILRSQVRLQWGVDDPRVEVRIGSPAFEELWRDGGEGDVFVFPEKFNGLSLPLQEARAAGMLVIAGDRFPINTWLPKEPLIPVQRYDPERVSGRCHEFDSAVYDPRAIAAKIDEWYGHDIAEYSAQGRAWAEQMSWDVLRERYLEVLSR